MIQLTVERILPLVGWEDIYVATNWDYRELVRRQLPSLPEKNILCEPTGKNTAPCIGLGAVHMAKKYGYAVMMVLPSDHLVKYNSIFCNTLRDACSVAERGANLVTLSITPDSPETGYGYIKFLPENTLGRTFEVERFVEKPDLETAKTYLATEQYLWNSGMFVWKISTILENLERFLPDTYAGLKKIQEAIGTAKEQQVLEQEFQNFQSVSIDYGVMEKTENIYVISSSFGWDDVGSWLAVRRIKKSNEFGNVIDGNVVAVDTKNTIVQGGKGGPGGDRKHRCSGHGGCHVGLRKGSRGGDKEGTGNAADMQSHRVLIRDEPKHDKSYVDHQYCQTGRLLSVGASPADK